MASPSDPMLAPLDERELQSRGLASPDSDGTRKLHRRWVYWSSEPDASAPEFITIPTFLTSKATLLHVGFTETGAAEVWHRWGRAQQIEAELMLEEGDDYDGMALTFLEFMMSTISQSHDTWSEQDQDWIAAMTTWGINSETQEAIIDPLCTDIRLSESCAYWVKDTLKIRYATLKQVQTMSKERNELLAEGRTLESIEEEF